jgi:glycosyltransferase involved in cell wall biosynthesis
LKLAHLTESVCIQEIGISGTAHRLLFEQAKLPALLRRLNADLLYCIADIGCVMAPCPVVVGCQNANIYTDQTIDWPPRLRMHFAMLRMLATSTARRAAKIITASEAWRVPIARRLGIASEGIAVVPHGVSDRFRALAGTRLAGNGVGRLAEGPWLSVSSVYRYKNYLRLIDAMSLLRTYFRADRRLMIIGGDADSSYSRLLRSAIKREGLEKQVALMGEVGYEAVTSYYSTAAAFVFPSYLETFGHPLLEAMSAALPVAASDIPVFREVAAGGAVYFDPSDSRDIAAKMAKIDRDGHHREQLSKAGLARSMEFTWRKTAARTVGVFEAAAGRRLVARG